MLSIYQLPRGHSFNLLAQRTLNWSADVKGGRYWLRQRLIHELSTIARIIQFLPPKQSAVGRFFEMWLEYYLSQILKLQKFPWLQLYINHCTLFWLLINFYLRQYFINYGSEFYAELKKLRRFVFKPVFFIVVFILHIQKCVFGHHWIC